MKLPSPVRLPLFAALLAIAAMPNARANEDFYPPTDAAKKFIDLDGHGFIVNGQRTYIESGSIHYPRVPAELWRDRLMRLRRASFNTVQTYAFWNYSEPRENEWHLNGNGDLGAFLDIAKSLGLYATVRPGPYVCAEWDFGGFPVWLKFKPGVIVRTDDAPYLEVNDHWYDKILPIIAAHQINRGGNVIMVQLENEHRNDWGVVHNPYFDHLEAKAEEKGIEVPHFMSGMHHGASPTPNAPIPESQAFPWYSTETWNGWFDTYGDVSGSKLRAIESAQWNTMAKGGAGQNFYMAHGGTDFDTWNYGGVAASYDYGAPIGQTGDLRPIYYRMKRANQFAESFAPIISGSDATGDYTGFISGAVVDGARRSSAGTAIFLRNTTNSITTGTFKDGSTITMRRHEPFAILQDAAIADGVKIAETTARVLAVAHNGSTTTVVVYGVAGDKATLKLASVRPMNPGNSTSVTLPLKFPASGALDQIFTDGRQEIRVVAINTDLAWYTWVTGVAGKQLVVLGPEYLSDYGAMSGKPTFLIERPYKADSPQSIAVYGAGAPEHLAVTAHPALDDAPAPSLGAWKMSEAVEARADYDDSKWKGTTDPEQMGTDGDNSAFAWYRAAVQMSGTAQGTIYLRGADHLTVFVNGKPVQTDHRRDQWEAYASFNAGKNTIAVFTSHEGRPDLYNYVGPLANNADKGLFGPVSISTGTASIPVTNWKMRGGVSPAAFTAWNDATAATDGTPAMYRTSFQAAPPATVGAHPIYRATSSGLTRGTMWLNGHNLGRYPEKIRVNGLYLPECWLSEKGNTLEVFDENGASPAAVKVDVETGASREVIRVDQPCAATTPIVVPAEDTADSSAKANIGNLAYKKEATASSTEQGNDAANATDGDIDSRWCASGPQGPQWLKVDLGSAQKLGTCEIVWENRAIWYQYTLEGSIDGTTWQKLGDQQSAVPQSPDSPAQLSRLLVPGATARYLRVTVNRVDQSKWASICELRAYKPQ